MSLQNLQMPGLDVHDLEEVIKNIQEMESMSKIQDNLKDEQSNNLSYL